MQQSKRRRKQRALQLALWEAELRRTLDATRVQLRTANHEEIPDDILVAEALQLADPLTYAGMDAVIPAPRTDLAASWFRARLLREADSDADRRALARRIAPAPDFDPPGQHRYGITRGIVERAVRYYAQRN